MQTKIEAAKIATGAGTHLIIASGRVDHPLRAIAEGARCTWFLAAGNPVTARKKWIAGSLEPKGTLTIDAGAVAALRRGNSLLPVGVVRVEGGFDRGDAVIIRGPDGAEIGRGLCAYDAKDAQEDQGPLVRRTSPQFSASAAGRKWFIATIWSSAANERPVKSSCDQEPGGHPQEAVHPRTRPQHGHVPRR